ncbi:hypothetical protein RhiirA5_439246 [Rhizophagus irregularis]|uniref:Uncharacterized protein n=1 Tax=Rhizophagus irregularis TaxID=588596 RepID=A0A2N0NI35_9GLOM|nr:hypothetical protein RhiirA5_439246 [Rhizophagus irregularis]
MLQDVRISKSEVNDFVKLEESHSEKNIKEFFLKSFKDFEIITKIFDITTDNASNNNTFFEEVSNEVAEKNIEFDNVNQHVYYLTYIINLTTQKAFKLLKAIVNINENEFLNQYENIQNNNNQVGVVGSILYKPLNTLNNSNINLCPFILNEKEWECLAEIELILKVNYNL